MGLVLFVLLAVPALVLIFNNRPPNIRIPSHKVPKDNALDDFLKAEELVRRGGMLGPVSSTKPASWWTRARYEAWMKASAAGRAKLREGLKKEFCWLAERGTNFVGGEAQLRELARTLASEREYYQFVADYDRAAESVWDCLELGAVVPRGGGLIKALTASAVFQIGKQELPVVMPKLSPDALDHAAARLRRIGSRWAGPEEVMAEEGRVHASMYANTFADTQTKLSLIDPRKWVRRSEVLYDQRGPKTRRVVQNARLAFANKSVLLRRNRSVGEEMTGTYTGRIRTPLPNNDVIRLSVSTGVTGTHTMGMRDIWFMFSGRSAQLTLLETEVALRRYRARHGHYPAKLSQLVPTLLRSVPKDPFGSKSIRYKRTAAGFLLYSVGPDLKDSGRVAATSRGSSAKGDIYWDRP